MATLNVFQNYPDAEKLLIEGCQMDVVLLMTDLSPFSSTINKWNAEDVRIFLNGYYQYVTEAITQYNGVVEKFIGDAVVAVFGGPFEKREESSLMNARDAARSITESTYKYLGSVWQSKTAIVNGECFLGFIGTDLHEELTVVGNPMTALFRLEDICPKQSYIVPESDFELMHSNIGIGVCISPPYWSRGEVQKTYLKGVGECFYRVVEYVT